jgi:hypothetical protein
MKSESCSRRGIVFGELVLLMIVVALVALFCYSLRVSSQRAINKVSWMQQTRGQVSFFEQFLMRNLAKSAVPDMEPGDSANEKGITVFAKKLQTEAEMGERVFLRIPQGIVAADESAPECFKWIELFLGSDEQKSGPLGTLYCRERLVPIQRSGNKPIPTPGNMRILVENVVQVEASLPAIGTEALFVCLKIGYPHDKRVTEQIAFRFTPIGSAPILFR